MKIINLSDISDTKWHWLKQEFNDPALIWSHYSSASIKLPSFLPKKDSIARSLNAVRAVASTLNKPSLLVSHGPRPSYYGASMAKLMQPNLPHLAYSFNFTDLPVGFQHKSMAKAYQQVDRFVVYSSLEKKLYADYFDLSLDKIDMLHWAVHAPKVDLSTPPVVAGRYICALGSQGRDYKTLFAAMHNLKHIQLVLVATADSVQSLQIPDNVKLLTNVPLAQAHNVLAHSQLMVLPLRDSQVPCGHVTIVSGMFFNKAIIVTNSEGVHDYIQDKKTGLFFNAQDVADLTQKIAQLWEDTAQTEQLAHAGFAFANTHCTEHTVVDYFQKYLKTINVS